MSWHVEHARHLALAAMLVSSVLSLTAAQINPPFQQFTSGSDFDLEGSALTYTPNGMFESYSYCAKKQDGYNVLF